MIHQPTVQFSMLPQSILNELGIREGNGICSKCCFFSLRCIMHLQLQEQTVFTGNEFLSPCCDFHCKIMSLPNVAPPEAWWLQLFNTVFQPCPRCTENYILYCKWCAPKYLHNYMQWARNIRNDPEQPQKSKYPTSCLHTLHILFNFSSLSFFPFPCSQTNSLWIARMVVD